MDGCKAIRKLDVGFVIGESHPAGVVHGVGKVGKYIYGVFHFIFNPNFKTLELNVCSPF